MAVAVRFCSILCVYIYRWPSHVFCCCGSVKCPCCSPAPCCWLQFAGHCAVLFSWLAVGWSAYCCVLSVCSLFLPLTALGMFVILYLPLHCCCGCVFVLCLALFCYECLCLMCLQLWHYTWLYTLGFSWYYTCTVCLVLYGYM